MPFKKGISPNPLGRPKRGKAKGEFDFNGKCRKKGKELFERLETLSKSSDPAISLKATTELIAYGYAKPKQEVELSGADGGPLLAIIKDA